MKRYFFITNHYMEKPKDFGLKKVKEGLFKNSKGEEYYLSEGTSFDKGVGAENVFIYNKVYSFQELFNLAVSYPENIDDNNLGAIAFIINGTCKQKDFVNEFIRLIKNKFLNSNEYKNWNLKYFQLFFFSNFNKEVDVANLFRFRENNDWREIEEGVLNKLNLLLK